MNINLHNYEEYFILYMDNELSIDDRRQVEDFVQKNPDLKADLNILLQYKLVPDTNIVFENKEELMKLDARSSVTTETIDEVNYPQWLLLYMDNELDADQKKMTETFISTHPACKAELDILLRTQFQPEKIEFPFKESLYRKESAPVRVIPVRWWRIAAAAILFLAIGLTVALVLNKRSHSDKNDMAKLPANTQKSNPDNTAVIRKKEEPSKSTLPAVSDNARAALADNSVKATGKSLIKNSRRPENEIASQKKVNNQEKDKENPVIAKSDEKPSNNLPQPIRSATINEPTKENDGNMAGVNAKGRLSDEESNPDNNVTSDNVVTTRPTQTSNKGIETASLKDNNELSQSGGKKSKLRGFFRKLTRTFEKTTKMDATDDDRVLIGGLAFKLK